MEELNNKIEELMLMAREKNATLLICASFNKLAAVGFNGSIKTGSIMIASLMDDNKELETVITTGALLFKAYKQNNDEQSI